MRVFSKRESIVLGAGMTGLAAGLACGCPVLDQSATPGGICSSYYMRANSTERLSIETNAGEDAYRFEVGGGHWIFAGDHVLSRFLASFGSLTLYDRRSSVFFPDLELYVPYPLQNNLRCLPKEIRQQALAEMSSAESGITRTMAESLIARFGVTLTNLFFGPFHRMYTAGLWESIAPQDAYKTPVDMMLVRRGAIEETPEVGYNATFLYPDDGLGILAARMTKAQPDVRLCHKVVHVDIVCKEVLMEDGNTIPYSSVISTIPLNRMLDLCGTEIDEPSDPFTSVLVLNIGARRGPKCPLDHWVYLPSSKAGFHRIGFYSNVDRRFLPRSFPSVTDRVSIYVERAYPGSRRPNSSELGNYIRQVVSELQDWAFINEVDVVDPSWVEVGYTWSWPDSRWRTKAVKMLAEHRILMAGRYGKWHFQGIAESVRDGLCAGATCREQIQPH